MHIDIVEGYETIERHTEDQAANPERYARKQALRAKLYNMARKISNERGCSVDTALLAIKQTICK